MSSLIDHHITNRQFPRRLVDHRSNLLKIRTKNIQNNTAIGNFWKLAKDSDIVFMQETKFKKPSQRPISCRSHRSNHTDWLTSLENTLERHDQELIYSTQHTRAAIILNYTHQQFSKIRSNNLSLNAEMAPQVADVILQIKETNEYFLFICIYGPSGQYSQQTDLFEALQQQIDAQIEKYYIEHNATLHLCVGGDFNMVQNPILDSDTSASPTAEIPARQAFNSIYHSFHLQDCLRCLNPTIKLFTNQNRQNCRRLDRIYFSWEVKDRIWQYGQHKHKFITSTHTTVDTSIIILPEATLKIGKPRFTLRDHWIDSEKFLEVMKRHGYQNYTEYVERIPEVLSYIGRKPGAKAPQRLITPEKALFNDLSERFKGITRQSNLTLRLTSADGSHTETTTEGILKIQRDFYANLYLDSQPQEAKRLIGAYVQKFRKKISLIDQRKLEESITLEELTTALSRTTNQSTPGKDGVPYRYLKKVWQQVGPLLVITANEIMETGLLPHNFALVLIRIIPKHTVENPTINNFRPISLIDTGLRAVSYTHLDVYKRQGYRRHQSTGRASWRLFPLQRFK